MIDLEKIHPGMEVVASDGRRLGTVDRLLGHRIFLQPLPDRTGGELSVPLSWVLAVDDAVRIAKSIEQVRQEWEADPGQTA